MLSQRPRIYIKVTPITFSPEKNILTILAEITVTLHDEEVSWSPLASLSMDFGWIDTFPKREHFALTVIIFRLGAHRSPLSHQIENSS